MPLLLPLRRAHKKARVRLHPEEVGLNRLAQRAERNAEVVPLCEPHSALGLQLLGQPPLVHVSEHHGDDSLVLAGGVSELLHAEGGVHRSGAGDENEGVGGLDSGAHVVLEILREQDIPVHQRLLAGPSERLPQTLGEGPVGARVSEEDVCRSPLYRLGLGRAFGGDPVAQILLRLLKDFLLVGVLAGDEEFVLRLVEDAGVVLRPRVRLHEPLPAEEVVFVALLPRPDARRLYDLAVHLPAHRLVLGPAAKPPPLSDEAFVRDVYGRFVVQLALRGRDEERAPFGAELINDGDDLPEAHFLQLRGLAYEAERALASNDLAVLDARDAAEERLGYLLLPRVELAEDLFGMVA